MSLPLTVTTTPAMGGMMICMPGRIAADWNRPALDQRIWLTVTWNLVAIELSVSPDCTV